MILDEKRRGVQPRRKKFFLSFVCKHRQPVRRSRPAQNTPRHSASSVLLRDLSGATSATSSPRVSTRRPTFNVASLRGPRVTADGGGRFAPPPTPRAGKATSTIVWPCARGGGLRKDDNAARIATVTRRQHVGHSITARLFAPCFAPRPTQADTGGGAKLAALSCHARRRQSRAALETPSTWPESRAARPTRQPRHLRRRFPCRVSHAAAAFSLFT